MNIFVFCCCTMFLSVAEWCTMKAKDRHGESLFWRKVKRGIASECWLWLGATNGRRYDMFRRGKGAHHYAHRYSYALSNGEIPAGIYILHRCDNPPCVNPAHLFAGTQRDNIADMMAKGRQAIQPRKTHCHKGHEFTPDNTARRIDGSQRCRECTNAPRRKVGGRGPYREKEIYAMP